MNFRQQIAKYVTGNTTTDQLPDIGIKAIEEGLNAPSLYILAGLDKNEDPFQIECYFKLALDELKIQLPNKREAAIEYIIAIVDEVLKDRKKLIDGIGEIYKALHSYDFYLENRKYWYDSIRFQTAYGLFNEYRELYNGETEIDANTYIESKEKQSQLLMETEGEIFKELRKRREQINITDFL